METTYQQLIRQRVQDNSLPRHVYRMRPVNRHLLDSLINGELWFSGPQHFNDPFDCNIRMQVIHASPQEMKEYYDAHLIRLLTNRERKEVDVQGLNAEVFERLLNAAASKVIRRKGVACFLSNCEHLLTWAHYADAHKGVCLKFDVQEDEELFSTAKKVVYSKVYPMYDHLRDRNDFVNTMFHAKSIEWQYEGEVRVLKDAPGNYPFQKDALVEVIFGCRMIEKDLRTLKRLIRRSYPHCILKQARINPQQFGLDHHEIQ